MSRVNFFEIKSNRKWREAEARINRLIAEAGISKAAVHLFETEDGSVGYNLQLVPTAGGKKALDRIHRIVCDELGYRRGRPPGSQTHQLKCRISETAFRRLNKVARRRRITPSRLAADLVERNVPES